AGRPLRPVHHDRSWRATDAPIGDPLQSSAPPRLAPRLVATTRSRGGDGARVPPDFRMDASAASHPGYRTLLTQESITRSTPHRGEASHGRYWHRRAQEGKADPYSG